MHSRFATVLARSHFIAGLDRMRSRVRWVVVVFGPRRTSPSTSLVGESRRRSAMNVPFLLPRSSTVASSPAILISACRRETPGELRKSSRSGSRPIT